MCLQRHRCANLLSTPDRANTIERDASPGVPYCSSGPRDIEVIIYENHNAKQKDWNQHVKSKLGYLSNEDKKLLAAVYVKKVLTIFKSGKRKLNVSTIYI